MPKRNTPDDYEYYPLRQGDPDGLCGVYAVLNALQFLVPDARTYEFLSGVFDGLLEEKGKEKATVITLDNVRDGGEEPEIAAVHAFVAKRAKAELKVDFLRIPHGADAKSFKTPYLAMEAKFKEKEKGVFVFGFEGRDSHFTVARSVTPTRVMLFDSWEYGWFEREAFLWGAPKKTRSKKVIVDPKEFDWFTLS